MRRGYLYRTKRKISFLLRRGSLFRAGRPGNESPHKDNTISRGTFTLVSVNSTFLFLLGYIIVFLLYGIATAMAAYAFDIPSVIYYNDVAFLIKGVGWTADSVKVVYSAGPLASLLAGIILLITYNLVAEENGILRLLVLWMFAHAVVFFFGEIMMGSLFGRGFGYVLMYLYAKDTVMMVVTVLCLIGMIALGFRFARLFVVSANIYFNEMPAFYTRKFLTFQFIVPFIAGNVIIYLVKLPGTSLYDITLNLTMIFLLIPVMIEGSRREDFYFDEDPRRPGIYFLWAAVVLAAVVAFRILLGNGLKLFS